MTNPLSAADSIGVVTDIAALEAGTATDIGTLTGAEIVAVSKSGLFQTTLTAIGAWIIGTYKGFTQTGTGAVGRTITDRLSEFVSVVDFGAVGDNATDDLVAFNAATAYCISASKKLIIPRRSYVLSAAWTITAPIDIVMDPSANLRFTGTVSAGVVFDFRAASANFGLNAVRLGGLYSPAINSSFSFPGYPSAWSSSQRSAFDAVTLMGGSRITIEVQYSVGWNAAFRPSATYDATNGARAPLNIGYRCNTADLNTYGVYFDAGPANAASLGAIDVEFNTCFAKYPIYYYAATHSISQCHARITGQSFVNEVGGAIVFGAGANINTCVIDVAWAYAGYSAYDSPTGTSTTFSAPFVAGTLASNTNTTDGNSTIGYFGGSNNRIRVGLAIDQYTSPGGALPANGVVTRVRDVGTNNSIVVGFYEQSQGAALALSTTQGETNFNGGAGGASIARRTLVAITVPTMANVTETSFYFYNCLLSAGQTKPIRIVPVDSSIGNSKMNFLALDNSANVNRECIVQVTNLTGASVTGATYYAWLVVDA